MACSLLLSVPAQAQYFGIGKKKPKTEAAPAVVEQPSLLNEWQKSNNLKLLVMVYHPSLIDWSKLLSRWLTTK